LRQDEEEKHSVLDSNKAKKIKLDVESARARKGHRTVSLAELITDIIIIHSISRITQVDDDS